MSANSDGPSANDWKSVALLHQAQAYLFSEATDSRRYELAADLERAVEFHEKMPDFQPNPRNLFDLLHRAVDSLRSSASVEPITKALNEAIETVYPYSLVQQRVDRDDLLLVADLDALHPVLITELLAALDCLHRAYGGGGLIIRTAHTGSAASAVGVSV